MGQIPVVMICRNEVEQKEAGALMKRSAAAMSAVLSFSNKMSDLDEDAPNLTAQVAPLVERLTLTLMSIYPDQRQMSEDIKALGDFRVQTLEELKTT